MRYTGENTTRFIKCFKEQAHRIFTINVLEKHQEMLFEMYYMVLSHGKVDIDAVNLKQKVPLWINELLIQELQVKPSDLLRFL